MNDDKSCIHGTPMEYGCEACAALTPAAPAAAHEPSTPPAGYVAVEQVVAWLHSRVYQGWDAHLAAGDFEREHTAERTQ